jgi:hypothetical protein
MEINEILGGIRCPIPNRNIGNDTANSIEAPATLSCNCARFILFFKICATSAPIPRPKKAIEIAIKAKLYHNMIENNLVRVNSNNSTHKDIMKREASRTPSRSLECMSSLHVCVSYRYFLDVHLRAHFPI